MVFKTSNDPVLYVALLQECWATTPPHNGLWISAGWLGKQQQDPPPARVRKHDWLHMEASSTITTAGIYLAGPPHHLLLFSSYHLVRKCVIGLSRGSLWGEALEYYEVRNSPSSGLLQDHTRKRKTLSRLCARS